MPLADYFHRAAVATAQILEGYDEEAIRDRLGNSRICVSFVEAEASLPEGRYALDLLVRLLARLYPILGISANAGTANELQELAQAINPDIELISDGDVDVVVALGTAPSIGAARQTIHFGSEGWIAHVRSDGQTCRVGSSTNPFGAGAAAALAAANVFRAVFVGADSLDDCVAFDTAIGDRATAASPPASLEGIELGDSNVLVGAGAIGNAAAWALARVPANGRLWLVDPEAIELSNLQRYVLASRADEGRYKTDLVAAQFEHSTLAIEAMTSSWAEFVSAKGYRWERALVALDSAADRRAVQASLPRWLANGWTQPGDLGVSVHPWTDAGACLACLYLPDGQVPSEDALIARALGLDSPQWELQIRNALHVNGPAPFGLLEEAARSLDVPLSDLEPFASRPLRELYVEGICGGVVLPLDRVGRPAQDVHVPVAHQSALAGVLLAAAAVADAAGTAPESTRITRIDVLRPMAHELAQPAKKPALERCICQDSDYRLAYELKYARKAGGQ